jgi:hypothetical protein
MAHIELLNDRLQLRFHIVQVFTVHGQTSDVDSRVTDPARDAVARARRWRTVRLRYKLGPRSLAYGGMNLFQQSGR